MSAGTEDERAIAVVVKNGWCVDCGGINEHYDHCLSHKGVRIVNIPPFTSGCPIWWKSKGGYGWTGAVEATFVRLLPGDRAEITFAAWPNSDRQQERTTQVSLDTLELRP